MISLLFVRREWFFCIQGTGTGCRNGMGCLRTRGHRVRHVMFHHVNTCSKETCTFDISTLITFLMLCSAMLFERLYFKKLLAASRELACTVLFPRICFSCIRSEARF